MTVVFAVYCAKQTEERNDLCGSEKQSITGQNHDDVTMAKSGKIQNTE